MNRMSCLADAELPMLIAKLKEEHDEDRKETVEKEALEDKTVDDLQSATPKEAAVARWKKKEERPKRHRLRSPPRLACSYGAQMTINGLCARSYCPLDHGTQA
jgi:hypothetical protein